MMTKFLGYTLASILTLGLISQTANSAQLLDRIIAIAGDDIVMMSELRTEARDLFRKLKQAQTNPMPSQDQILTRSLDALILKKLQLNEAKRLGIAANQETVAQAISRIADSNQLSVPELRQTLAEEGMEFRQFSQGIKDQIILSRLISREVTNRVQVSKSEVDQHLKRTQENTTNRQSVNLLHILIATPDGASSAQIKAAKQKATSARTRIDNGENFSAVAQDLSDGERAINGGDVGWLNFNELPASFAEPLSNMQKGAVKGPFQSTSGFHIIKAAAFRSGTGANQKIIQQTHARHILIRTDELTSDDDAQQRLSQIRERAVLGDDFETLARSNSADQASAIKGGDLDWVSPGNMVADFERVMDKTAAGKISEPFKTQFGWHIIQVVERRSHDATEESRRNDARRAVRDRKAKAAEKQYLRRLRDEAFVEIRLENNL